MIGTQWKNAWRLMRIPFSIFLMPIFWLGVATLPGQYPIQWNTLWVFIILHLFLYPASNGYNCLMDRDTGPIGGLKEPPPVNAQLAILVFIFDLLALVGSFLVHIYFGFMVSVYWLFSKAYSSDKIRLKKMPYVSWMVVVIFQGAWTVLMTWTGIENREPELALNHNWVWPVVASLFLAGTYPITQVYQHKMDAERGDESISMKLGIRGTFILAQAGMALGSGFLVWGIWHSAFPDALFLVAAATSPILIYFFSWQKKVWNDPQAADFEHTMRFNQFSSIALSMAFLLWIGLQIGAFSLHLHPKF